MDVFYSMRLHKGVLPALGIVLLLAIGGSLALHFFTPVGCTTQDLAPTTQQTAARAAQASTGSSAANQQPAEGQADKVVYLTFDDGPSATTGAVLDALAQEDVPATFFVVAAENNEAYLPLLARIAAEGHTIALHSGSHNYKKIYADPAAFWADLETLKEKIRPYVARTDIVWMRFPGGSTNTVSHKYGGKNVMQTLKAQALEKGYRYVDWNVDASDAVGGSHSAQAIYNNVVRGAKGQTSCIVLMHDTKATRTTAQALPQIIQWFKSEGYRFDTIDHLPVTVPSTDAAPTSSA